MYKKKILKIKKSIISFIKKENDYIKLSLILFAVVPFLLTFETFSKYVISDSYDKYLLSKEFYVNSNALNGNNYLLYDWDGETNYVLSVDLENYIDELRWTQEPINYNVNVSCNPNISGNVSCTGSNGTINYSQSGGTSNKINISLSNPNNLSFNENDYVDMNVSVITTSPYRKTLNASFRIHVKLETVKYSITDAIDQEYFDLILSNYNSEYKSISLSWDYSFVNIDNMNSAVDMTSTGNVKDVVPRTTTINSKTYVNGTTFNLKGKTSIIIRFYKTDKTQNYTFPIGNNTSIITLTTN